MPDFYPARKRIGTFLCVFDWWWTSVEPVSTRKRSFVRVSSFAFLATIFFFLPLCKSIKSKVFNTNKLRTITSDHQNPQRPRRQRRMPIIGFKWSWNISSSFWNLFLFLTSIWPSAWEAGKLLDMVVVRFQCRIKPVDCWHFRLLDYSRGNHLNKSTLATLTLIHMNALVSLAHTTGHQNSETIIYNQLLIDLWQKGLARSLAIHRNTHSESGRWMMFSIDFACSQHLHPLLMGKDDEEEKEAKIGYSLCNRIYYKRAR